MTKKVLRIIARLNIGGPSIHVTNLNYYLDKTTDYSSTLAYGSLAQGEGSMEYLAKEKQLKTILIPELGREISLIKDFKTIFKLYQIIKKEKPDIVHTHTAKAGTVGRVAAKLAGVKQIYHTFHGHVFHSYFSPIKTKIYIIIEMLLAKLTTQIIAISEKQKEELLAINITKREHISVIPLGFELEKLQNITRGKYWREKLNIPQQNIIIGIIGRLVPVKDHEYFVNLSEKVLAFKKNVTFLIIGDGELKPQLQQMVNEKNLRNSILFTGFETDLSKIYGDLDIVVLTSKNEGTPVTLIESLACGIPVISANVGGISDFVKHKVTGYLEDKNNIEVFTKDLMEIIDNYPEALAMAKVGQQEILAKFDVQRLVKDINNLYSSN